MNTIMKQEKTINSMFSSCRTKIDLDFPEWDLDVLAHLEDYALPITSESLFWTDLQSLKFGLILVVSPLFFAIAENLFVGTPIFR